MNKIKPQTLKGFRDFLPDEKKKRDYVVSKIKATFELFGFEPIETPTLEYASLLLGKYGKETDKLIYTFKDRAGRNIALRYDQTVPMARLWAQTSSNPNLFPKIMRRYQIQNVFRGDNPQKGRYREFKQCDCDIFGTIDNLADAEILATFYKTFYNLGLKNIEISVNDRRSLFNTIWEVIREKTKLPKNWNDYLENKTKSILQCLDKIDKKGKDAVINKIADKELVDKKIALLIFDEISKLKPNESFQNIINLAITLGIPKKNIKFNPFLARGLDYYTALIFEGTIPNFEEGSVGGGGRYDNLIKELTNYSCAAVGFGIGFDRTINALDRFNLFPKEITLPNTKVLVIGTENTIKDSIRILNTLRKNRINCEISLPKFEKALKYADKKGIPYVLIIGPDEAKNKKVTLKDMKSGKQKTISLDQAIQEIK